MKLSDFLSQDAELVAKVNPTIKEAEQPLSIQSAMEQRANLVAESLTQLSPEMRGLIDLLVSIDRLGGDLRDSAVENVRNILRSLPSGKAASEHKELKKRL